MYNSNGIKDSSRSDKVLSIQKDSTRGLSYQVGLSICSKMIAFLSLYLYANILPSDQISKLAVLQALVVGIVAVLSIQLPTTLFRHSIEAAYIKSSLWLSNKSSIVLGVSLIVIPIALYSNDSLIGMALVLGLVQIAAFMKLEIIRAIDEGGKYYRLILFQVAASVLLTLLTLRFFYKSNGVLVYATYEFISWVFVFIVSTGIIKKWSRDYENRRAVFIKKQIIIYFKYGMFLIPTAISWWVITQAPILISSFLLESEEVAMYAISNRMPNMIALVSFIFLSVGSKNLALIYEIDPSAFKNKFFIYGVYWVTFFLIISIIVLILNWIFLVNYYPEYVLSFAIQSLQVVNSFFIAIFSFFGYGYIATKKVKYSSITSMLASVIGTLVSYFFGVKFGLIGVISGMTIGIVIGLALRVLHINGISFEKNYF